MRAKLRPHSIAQTLEYPARMLGCRPHRIDHWARSYQTPRKSAPKGGWAKPLGIFGCPMEGAQSWERGAASSSRFSAARRRRGRRLRPKPCSPGSLPGHSL